MSIIINFLKKLKGRHIGLAILIAGALVYIVWNMKDSRLEHLKNGGVLACGKEGKTEVIDEGYRLSKTGLAILSKTGKKWKLKQCTPFPAIAKKDLMKK